MTITTVNGNIILIHSVIVSHVLRDLPADYKENGFAAKCVTISDGNIFSLPNSQIQIRESLTISFRR
jgi:hypothetical protein